MQMADAVAAKGTFERAADFSLAGGAGGAAAAPGDGHLEVHKKELAAHVKKAAAAAKAGPHASGQQPTAARQVQSPQRSCTPPFELMSLCLPALNQSIDQCIFALFNTLVLINILCPNPPSLFCGRPPCPAATTQPRASATGRGSTRGPGRLVGPIAGSPATRSGSCPSESPPPSAEAYRCECPAAVLMPLSFRCPPAAAVWVLLKAVCGRRFRALFRRL